MPFFFASDLENVHKRKEKLLDVAREKLLKRQMRSGAASANEVKAAYAPQVPPFTGTATASNSKQR